MIEATAAEPDFWSNQDAAQKLLQRRSSLERTVARQEKFEGEISDVEVLFEFAESDEASLNELRELLNRLAHEVSEVETETLLAGENDLRNAICTIHPGAGGTESQDWAEMLLRMYLKWAERRGFKTEIIDYQPAEEAGIKSVTFKVDGEYAYGLLAAEAGVHRLVRISPFDQAARRHTSFASLFVYPEIDEEVEVEINDKDLRVDTYRATGAGGQHINTTDSAVRITHPEPAFTASEPRGRHAGLAFAAVRNGVGKAPRGNEGAGSEPARHLVRLADSQLRACALPSGEGRADETRARRRGFRAQWRHR